MAIVIPVRNEENHIAACLRAVLDQDYPAVEQVLVIDGESTDRTCEVASSFPGVAVLTNARRMQAAALNVGLAAATAEIFVRVDGHCEIEPDYVTQCVRVLDSSRAALVGGGMTPVAEGAMGRGVVRAMTSRFGAGPARFHVGGKPGWVETVYLGAGYTSMYQSLGGFSEEVGVNEDTELAIRAAAVGGVWFDPAIRSTYVPRGSVKAIIRQFFRYGLSRAATTRKHPRSLRARQTFAPLLVLALLLFPRRRFVVLAYGLIVASAVADVARDDVPAAAAVALVLPSMHLSWGTGFLLGIAGWPPPGRCR